MNLFPFSFASLRRVLLPAVVVATAATAGCAGASPGAVDAAVAEEGEDVAEAEEELSAAANTGYFVVTRRDFRKCAAPLCGGFFVKRVNAVTTRCADGTMQAECYVSEITVRGTGLSTREQADAVAAIQDGKALLEARTYKTKWNGSVIGTLKGNEVWLGATGSTPDGTFYRVADNGVRCITTPCPSVSAFELNAKEEHPIIGVVVDRTTVPADQDTQSRALSAVATEEGLLVAGGLRLPKCAAGAPDCGPQVIASELYFKMTPREGKVCGSRNFGGCNAGQFCNHAPSAICGRADAPGTCTYKPEICPTIHAPVCGCDGQTYGNACSAAGAGVSVDTNGECPAPPAAN